MDRLHTGVRYRGVFVVLAAMAALTPACPALADPNVNVTETYPLYYGTERYDMEFICYGGNYVIVSDDGGSSTPPRLEDVTVDGELRIPDGLDLSIAGTYTNDGLTLMQALHSRTELNIVGETTIAGPGELRLSNRIHNLIDGYDHRLTNAADHVIAGSGQIGDGDLPLTNDGVIDANQSTPLEVHPMPTPGDALASVVNAGTLCATGGGTLELHAGSYDNTGGVLLAGDGSTVEFHADAALTGGVLTTSGSGTIVSDVADGLADTPRIADLTNAGHIDVPSGKELRIGGTITNNGTITVSASYGYTVLTVDGNATLTGTGEVAMTADQYNWFRGAGDNRLTHGSNHTIRGGGQLGYDALAITNQGLILADTSEELVIEPGDSPDADADLVNTGTLRADGGTMVLQWGEFDNAGGTIEARPTGAVELHYGAQIDGGVLTTSGDGVIRATCLDGSSQPKALLTDLTNAGHIDVPSGRELRIGGTITNNGTITVSASYGYTVLTVDGNATLTGTGEVAMTADQYNWFRGAGDNRLTHGSNHTIRGGGQLGYDALAITNQGLILADTSEELVIEPGDSPDADADLVNTGTLRADGGTMVLQWGEFDNAGGTIEARPTGAVELHYGAQIDGGVLTTSGDGVIRTTCLDGSSHPKALLTDLTNAGSLEVPVGKALRLGGTIVNDGTILVDGSTASAYLILDGNVTLAGTGRLILRDDDRSHVVDELAKGGPDTLINQADHTISGRGVIDVCLDNRGTVEVAAGDELTVNGDIVQIDGGTLTGGTWKLSANGRITPGEAGTLWTNQGTVLLHGQYGQGLFNGFGRNEGTLALSGQMEYTVEHGMFTNAGTLDIGPGSELYLPDVLDEFMDPLVIGELTLESSSTLAIGIDANGLSGVVDTSDAWIDGELVLSIDPNLQIDPLETIQILSAMGPAGRFQARQGEVYGQRALATNYVTWGVELVATVPGDASLDAEVDVSDLAILAAKWQQSDADWGDADFSGDGDVDVTDLAILAANWNRSLSKGAATVPEPTSLAMLAGASAWLIGSGRRRQREAVRRTNG